MNCPMIFWCFEAPSCIPWHLRLPDMSLKREYAGWPRRRSETPGLDRLGDGSKPICLPRLGE